MSIPAVFHSLRVTVAVVAAISMVLLSACGAGGSGAKAAVAAAVPVKVVAVERRDLPLLISSIGTVKPLNEVVIRPQVAGVLTQVLFREGQMVQKGAPLARIDDRTIVAGLAQVEAEKRSREAQLRSAELDMERYESLAGTQVISRQLIDQQRALVVRLTADVLASDATISAQKVLLSHTHIDSPLSGRVGFRQLDPGNLVRTSDEGGLVTVTQMDPISILFTVPQEALGRLRATAGAERGMTVTALDRDAGIALGKGRITTFDNQIDPATGTLRLRAEFANPDGKLWPGQFVTVRVQAEVSTNALVVPARAVQQGLTGSFVFRVSDSKAVVVPVVTVYQDDEVAIVRDGLAPGDSVVVDGQSRLRNGSAVKASLAGDAGGT